MSKNIMNKTDQTITTMTQMFYTAMDMPKYTSNKNPKIQAAFSNPQSVTQQTESFEQ